MRKAVVAAIVLFLVVGLPAVAAEDTSPASQQSRKTSEPQGQELRLPNVIASHMVLQRDVEVPIWGWADAGEKVTVVLGEHESTATAGPDGKWMVRLPAMSAGGPHKITVSAASRSIELEDVLVGEVWLCSGQSNMVWRLGRTDNGKAEIAAADWPRVRLFNVQRVARAEEAEDVGGSWKVCTPESIVPFSAVGYFFGRKIHEELDVPVGLINSSVGGALIQPWTPAEGYALVEEFAEGKIETPGQGGMYNGMIAPLVPLRIRGVIWYQGESNVKDGWIYYARMKALIAGWRKVWGQGDFPFYFVQLTPYAWYPVGMLPPFREAQAATLGVANTGMVVTTDLVKDLKKIHPSNKRDVGERLALWALAKSYGRDELVYSGPLYKSMTVKGNKIIVEFDHVGGGLASRDGKGLTHFEIAGEDKKFVPAKAVIVERTIEVSSEKVSQPVAARFAWSNTAQPNLINEEGLPGAPFRTDRW
ncbi:MAG: sialate O-acetylesterase [Planctomycetota bacterium]|jgi:sialate O-acetylesterase